MNRCCVLHNIRRRFHNADPLEIQFQNDEMDDEVFNGEEDENGVIVRQNVIDMYFTNN